MTILAGLVVNPKHSKPFVLIASDSRRVLKDPVRDEESGGTAENSKIYLDNEKKVFKPTKSLIIAFSGAPVKQVEANVLNFIKENVNEEVDLEVTVPLIHEYISKEFQNSSLFMKGEETSLITLIGGYINKVPSLAYFRMTTDELNPDIDYVTSEKGEFNPVFAGNRPPEQVTQNLQNKLSKINMANITSVRKVLEDFVKEAATHFPETCNDKVNVERLR